MRARALSFGLALAVCTAVPADQSGSGASAADERLVASANGQTLTGGSGGGGGALTWLRNFGTVGVLGAGAEYQQISNAHWTNGVLTGSYTLAILEPKTHVYAEAHEGAGDIGMRAFHYSLASGGILTELTPRLSVQLEERYIDIDMSHGHLPKLGLSLRVTPTLAASASYAYSFGGNLGTKLATGRIDYSGTRFRALAGVAAGPVSPAVINLLGHVIKPGSSLREGYLGVGKAVGRTEWLALGDYQNVSGTKLTTITLACTVHLDARGRAP